ncbi:CAAX protease self-immunity [Geodermatophilus obscurus]|uniref:CAAX protease self-immunity n=1 Tax=Geodermatophilus obscurus TaxID=1861 RepID=A0A1M7RXW4_9ACTN|nr:CPBP family intramembrane glutamic endopeptidase [Geodermatophilus obscurus]SHN50984.1 CAAX protease self-immunity [Geodermatophilus obscurus]
MSSPPSAARFLSLLLALSLPFYLAGWLAGDTALGPGLPLPVSAAMAICPGVAAIVLTRAERGAAAGRELLARAVELPAAGRRHRLLRAALVVPGATVASYLIQRLLGRDLPGGGPSVALIAGLLVFFLVVAAAEEIGWTGYLLPAARRRLPAPHAAVLIGVACALWHALPYAQAGHRTGWIAAQCLVTVALRVLTVWAYEGSGGALGSAVLLHASVNVSVWAFPHLGSHYDPVVLLPLLLVLAGWATRELSAWAGTAAGAPPARRGSLPLSGTSRTSPPLPGGRRRER